MQPNNRFRPLLLIAAWTLVAVVFGRSSLLSVLSDPVGYSFVIAIPLLLGACLHGPRHMLLFLRAPFDTEVEDLAPDTKRISAGVLRSLGSQSLAAGMLASLGSLVALFQAVATSQSTSDFQMVTTIGPMFLAPLFGLLLKTLFYDVLAARMESVLVAKEA